VKRTALLKRRKFGRRTAQCARQKGAVLKAVQDAKIGLAQPRRIFKHGIKNRLQLAGGLTDDAQNI
jgi:phage tail protein X